MPSTLSGSNQNSFQGRTGIFDSVNIKDSNLTKIISQNAQIDTANIKKLINPKLECIGLIVESMVDVSGCKVIGLKSNFKKIICDAVNNYCPYYCTDCSGGTIRGINFNNFNNFNSSDNDISFFHEELISNENFLNDNFSNDNFSIIDTEESINEKKTNIYHNFISTNLLSDELLTNNNLKIITIEKINKGIWLFNGNISIKIPKHTQITNLKLFIYLDENVVNSGEIDLGSQIISEYDVIRSFPFNLMFNNDLLGRELKIALIPFDNENEIIVLKSTNFFLKMI